MPENEEQIRNLAKWRSPMNHVTVMMKKKHTSKSGGYMPMRANEDYDLFVRMMQCGCTFSNMQVILVKVRESGYLTEEEG